MLDPAEFYYSWISQRMQEGIWTSKADQYTLDASHTPTPPECCDLQPKLWQDIRFGQMCLEQANAPCSTTRTLYFFFRIYVCMHLPLMFAYLCWTVWHWSSLFSEHSHKIRHWSLQTSGHDNDTYVTIWLGTKIMHENFLLLIFSLDMGSLIYHININCNY